MTTESEVLEVVRRHGRAMASMDPDFIASDYAEDAIVICNLMEKPAVGRAEIREMIAAIINPANLGDIDTDIDPEQMGDDEVHDMAYGEYALHIFTNRAAGMSGVESYQVRDNKIVFESATIQKI